MCTKMNASPGHPNGCGVDVYYSSMAQSNAHRCRTSYLTLNSRPSKDNIIHNKWERSLSGPFNVVSHTPIAMHIITTVIMALKMICTSRVPERQFRIVLNICGFGGAPKVTVAHLVHAVY